SEDSAIIQSPDAKADSGLAYHTLGGRTVYGGGGIHPDIEVKQDDVPKIATGLARQGLVFEFAVHYAATHKDVEDQNISNHAALMKEFQDFLKSKNFQYTDADFAEGQDFVDVMLRSEIARKIWGDEAAYKVAIEGDTQLQRTADLLKKAGSLSDLFKEAVEASAPAAEHAPAGATR
ncbi:MAG TPA: hypothetical protein VMU02_06870, partial [bacterium]|nr:hypothetical protein [bacterium]